MTYQLCLRALDFRILAAYIAVHLLAGVAGVSALAPSLVAQQFSKMSPAITVTTTQSTLRADAPKVIVVMSFDQMRGDYPNRWGHLWTQQGYNRIIRQGAYFPQCYFNHASNITAPGHSVHLTGMYPHKSGIVSNDYFDRTANRKLYCVQDSANKTFNMSKPEDWCSPVNLRVATLGDYLKTISPKSRVIGLSQKDRAAILMAGHKADAAYWFEYEAGGYTTGEYYFKELPTWVKRWNDKNSYRDYAGKKWNATIDDDFALPDTARWEGNFGRIRSVFPHTVLITNATASIGDTYNANTFTATPFSVEHFFKFAKAAFREEKIAQDNAPDLFCMSISATDYAGHAFGPDSRELQEMYVQVDKMMVDWVDYLDSAVGRKNYTMVITSDHGVAPVPEFTKSRTPNADAGRLRASDIIESMEDYLRKTFAAGAGAKWVTYFEPPSIFLNQETLELVTGSTVTAGTSLTRKAILDSLSAFLLRYPGIGIAVNEYQLSGNICPEGLSPWQFALVRNDYYPQRTGEIMFYPAKFWILGGATASHGTPHDYDRHTPLMLMGVGIKPGYYKDARVAPSDIAPTLAQILGITMDNFDGKPLPCR
jgi:arylsulfatase A-like enzyme